MGLAEASFASLCEAIRMYPPAKVLVDNKSKHGRLFSARTLGSEASQASGFM